MLSIIVAGDSISISQSNIARLSNMCIELAIVKRTTKRITRGVVDVLDINKNSRSGVRSNSQFLK
jgi:hypothetical protein